MSAHALARGMMGGRRITLACVLGLAIQQAGAQQPARTDRSKPLEGRWTIELQLDERSERNIPTSKEIKGQIAFDTGSWWGNADRFGRHDVDLRPFFGRLFAKPLDVPAFGTADTSILTEVSGRLTGDSVRIDFVPRLDRWGVSLRGRFYGDSSRGEWYRRGTDGAGRFTLRRLSKEPVSVAAIPVPPRTLIVATSVTAPKKLSKAEARKAARDSAAKVVAAKAAARDSARKVAAAAKAAARDSAARVAALVASEKAAARAAARDSAATRLAARAAAAASAKDSAATQAAAKAAARAYTKDSAAMQVAARAAARAAARDSAVAEAAATKAAKVAAKEAAKSPARASAATVTVASAKDTTRDTASTSAARDTAAGSIRVRLFDRTSKKWFATKYALQIPDGRWLFGNLRSGAGPDGWGPVLRRAPGRHVVEVADFLCGDKIWLLAKKVVTPVDVRPGETSDVTIELDIAAEPARRSFFNKSGTTCAEPPGNVR